MDKPTRRPFWSALALLLLALLSWPACAGEEGAGSDAGSGEPRSRTCDLPETCVPPPSVCKDANTLLSYVKPTCLLHVCRWSTVETSCPCEDGACVAPADAGLTRR